MAKILPIAHVYRQMANADIAAFVQTFKDKDGASFFFLRGRATIHAFHKGLGKATAAVAKKK